MTEEIYVRVHPLPGGVHGFTHLEPDGSYTIIISESDSPERRMQTYEHELEHIRRGDFDSEASVQQIELEAHHIEEKAPERMPSPAFEAMMARMKKRRRKLARQDREHREFEEQYGRPSEDELFARRENWWLEE